MINKNKIRLKKIYNVKNAIKLTELIIKYVYKTSKYEIYINCLNDGVALIFKVNKII